MNNTFTIHFIRLIAMSIGNCFVFFRTALELKRGDIDFETCYSKDHIKPSRWIRELFAIRDKYITVESFILFYLAPIGLTIGPVECFILSQFERKNLIFEFYMVQIAYCIIDLAILLIYHIKSEIARK